MRKFPAVANRPALHVCLCVPSAGYVCPECEAGTTLVQSHAIEEADALTDEKPWNDADLPEHLRGKGYRGACQDGYDGEEWITPDQHHAFELVELARMELDAVELP